MLELDGVKEAVRQRVRSGTDRKEQEAAKTGKCAPRPSRCNQYELKVSATRALRLIFRSGPWGVRSRGIRCSNFLNLTGALRSAVGRLVGCLGKILNTASKSWMNDGERWNRMLYLPDTQSE